MLSSLSPERRTVVAQLARFVVSGALVTALGVAVYAIVALVLRWHPQLGNFLAYVVAMASGYVMHSRWSFRDHGASGRMPTKVKLPRRLARSATRSTASGCGCCTRGSSLGRAAPIAPMLFVTPGVTFLLNRQWVFR